MIWEENLEESMGNWNIPWRIWSDGKSNVRYPEFTKLKNEWEWTRGQLQQKYEKREEMTDAEWKIWDYVKKAKF